MHDAPSILLIFMVFDIKLLAVRIMFLAAIFVLGIDIKKRYTLMCNVL